ncbi:MAG: hypothetical protein AB2L09_04435 [Coriobacteriia bacterium]
MAVVLYFGGWNYLSSLFGNASTASTQEPAATTPSQQPAENDTGTSSEPAETPSIDPDAQSRMYAQQLQSQAMIGDLAAGKISKIVISSPKVASDAATATIQAAYGDGGTVSGTISFIKYDGAWYLSAVTREGGTPISDTTVVDASIVKTITEQQAEYQEVIAGLLEGSYKTITLSTPTTNEGTVTIPVTAGGGKLVDRSGSVVLISKVINGSQAWFITSLR